MGYIYETKKVKAGRSNKTCSACGKSIKPGEPSITVTCFEDEYYAKTVCSDKCLSDFEANFGKEEDDEYDDAEDWEEDDDDNDK